MQKWGGEVKAREANRREGATRTVFFSVSMLSFDWKLNISVLSKVNHNCIQQATFFE